MGDPVDARPPWRGPRGFPLRAGHILHLFLIFIFASFFFALSQNQNIPLDFKYKGNNSPARLLAIAPCKDSKNFLKKQKKDGWLENALKFIASKSITSPDDVAGWIVNFVASNYEESFHTIASEHGYEKRRIMCPIETAAMITNVIFFLLTPYPSG